MADTPPSPKKANPQPAQRGSVAAPSRLGAYFAVSDGTNVVQRSLRDPVTTSDGVKIGPHPQSKAEMHVNLLPDALDRLREHPVLNRHLNLQEIDEHIGSDITTSAVLLAHAGDESEREPLYRLELLRMYRQRLRLVAFLGLLLLPMFHLFYAYIAPHVAIQARWTHGLMAAVCAIYVFLPSRITNLVWARLMTVVGYTLICMGASLFMVMLSQNQFEHAILPGLQVVMLAAHSQILLSVVLLPLTLWESLVMAAIVTLSLAWSTMWAVPFTDGSVFTSQLFVLLTTGVFVLCLAHFQTVLRQRAFDATFDLACSAAQLQTLSVLDAVTGGYNRLHLERALSLEINRAARFSHPLSVMMFDVDNFKSVNDTRGHTVGDEVLRLIDRIATDVVRDVDTIARYGGDEFMVVLPETESADALIIAERLQETVRSQLQSHFDPTALEANVTLSIGIITIRPTEPVPVDKIIGLTDERLYEAKRMGKNRIAC